MCKSRAILFSTNLIYFLSLSPFDDLPGRSARSSGPERLRVVYLGLFGWPATIFFRERDATHVHKVWCVLQLKFANFVLHSWLVLAPMVAKFVWQSLYGDWSTKCLCVCYKLHYKLCYKLCHKTKKKVRRSSRRWIWRSDLPICLIAMWFTVWVIFYEAYYGSYYWSYCQYRETYSVTHSGFSVCRYAPLLSLFGYQSMSSLSLSILIWREIFSLALFERERPNRIAFLCARYSRKRLNWV